MESQNKSSIAVRLTESGELVNSQTGEVLDPQSILKTSDMYIVEADASKLSDIPGLATGVVIPTYRKKSWDYLKEVHDFQEISENDVYKQIEVCDKLYRFEPIVGTVIDTFVDFAMTDFEILTDSKELKKIAVYLKDHINMFEPTQSYIFPYPAGMIPFTKEIASEWLISGNVFPYHQWQTTDVDGTEYNLPRKTVNLNPQSITIERLEKPLGAVSITYNPYGTSQNSSSGNNGTTINYNNTYNYKATVPSLQTLLGSKDATQLNHQFIYHVKRKASGFRLWGIPYLTKVFTAVKAKRKLRYLDDATIDGLVNYIIIFKIGSDNPESPYHKVTAARLSAFKALIENPQASNMIVWPHDVEIETVGPDGKVLEFKERYDVVDRDILRSMGIPSILLDGAGSSADATWVSILSLVEKLEDMRLSIADYLIYLFTRIAKVNNIDYKNISIRWKPSNLRDEKTIKTLLLAFYDRGLLPIETTLFQGGYEPEDIVNIKKKEKKDNLIQYFEKPAIPFDSPNNFNNPNMGNPNQKVNKGKLPGDTGRPSDKTNDTKKPIKSKASLVINKYVELIDSELDSLKEEFNQTRGKLDQKLIDRIFAKSIRIKDISDIFIDAEIRFEDETLLDKKERIKAYYEWRNSYIDSLMGELKESLDSNLSYVRKDSTANFITAGVFSIMKDKFNKFCDDTLYGVSLLSRLKDVNKSISMVGGTSQKDKISIEEAIKNLPFADLELVDFVVD